MGGWVGGEVKTALRDLDLNWVKGWNRVPKTFNTLDFSSNNKHLMYILMRTSTDAIIGYKNYKSNTFEFKFVWGLSSAKPLFWDAYHKFWICNFLYPVIILWVTKSRKNIFRILLTNQEEPTSGRLIDVLSPSTGYEGPLGVPGGEPVEQSRFLYAFLYD